MRNGLAGDGLGVKAEIISTRFASGFIDMDDLVAVWATLCIILWDSCLGGGFAVFCQQRQPEA